MRRASDERIIAGVFFTREDMRERRLIHLVHQLADLLRTHRRTGKNADFEQGTREQCPQPLLQVHRILDAFRLFRALRGVA